MHVNVFQEFMEGIVGVAAALPGPLAPIAKLLEIVTGFFTDLFNCGGPVFVGNAIYTPDNLNNFEQNQKACETRNYTYPTSCAFEAWDSNYTVTHCLERLDAKPASASAAVMSLPGLPLSLLGLAGALLYESFGYLV